MLVFLTLLVTFQVEVSLAAEIHVKPSCCARVVIT